VGQNLPGLWVCDLDNFFTPHGFYFVFDFAVWDGNVYDVVGDFSGFIWVFGIDYKDYFYQILGHFSHIKRSLASLSKN